MEFTLNFLLLTHAFLYTNVNSANILGIFHFQSRSHHVLGSALFKALAKKGHNVTMVSPFPLNKPLVNYTDVVLTRNITAQDDFLKHASEEKSYLEGMTSILNLFIGMTSQVLDDKPFQDFLKSDSKFDVVITSALMSEPFAALGHHFNAPIVSFCPVGSNPVMNYYSGNIALPSFVPSAFLPLSEDMTFFHRVGNTLAYIIFALFYRLIVFPTQDRDVKRTFPNAPPLNELLDNVNLYLVNSHYSLEGHRPYMTNLIQIGGFHFQEKEEVPEKLQIFLDNAKEGVVYFSLGTNMKSSQLGKRKIKAIKSAFARLPLKVLWKFDTDLPNAPKNVKIESWLPQRAVLAHPNVKLFITHGGYGGITEALYYGVPMVAMPIFGDQRSNVADCKRKEACTELDFKSFSEEQLWNAMQEVLTNPKYSQSAKKCSMLVQDQPINPMDHAIYWIEHVIKHNRTDHFKTITAKLPLYKYYLLDVIAFLSAAITTSTFIALYIIKLFIRFFCLRKISSKVKYN